MTARAGDRTVAPWYFARVTDDLVTQARASISRGDVLVAYDEAMAAVEADPDHLEARFVAALALARSGAVGRAQIAATDLLETARVGRRCAGLVARRRRGPRGQTGQGRGARDERARNGGTSCAGRRISTKRPRSSSDGSSRASTPRRCGYSRETSTGRASWPIEARRLVETDRASGATDGLLAGGDHCRGGADHR